MSLLLRTTRSRPPFNAPLLCDWLAPEIAHVWERAEEQQPSANLHSCSPPSQANLQVPTAPPPFIRPPTSAALAASPQSLCSKRIGCWRQPTSVYHCPDWAKQWGDGDASPLDSNAVGRPGWEPLSFSLSLAPFFFNTDKHTQAHVSLSPSCSPSRSRCTLLALHSCSVRITGCPPASFTPCPPPVHFGCVRLILPTNPPVLGHILLFLTPLAPLPPVTTATHSPQAWRPASRTRASSTSASSRCSSPWEVVSTARHTSCCSCCRWRRCDAMCSRESSADPAECKRPLICVCVGKGWGCTSVQLDQRRQYLAVLCNGIMWMGWEANRPELEG